VSTIGKSERVKHLLKRRKLEQEGKDASISLPVGKIRNRPAVLLILLEPALDQQQLEESSVQGYPKVYCSLSLILIIEEKKTEEDDLEDLGGNYEDEGEEAPQGIALYQLRLSCFFIFACAIDVLNNVC
jgi:hypothetical protein